MSIIKSVVVLLGLMVNISATSFADINIVSDRSAFHVEPIMESFFETTGIPVNSVFVDKGSLPARLQSRVDNADVYIATDIVSLVYAKRKGFTQPIRSSVLDDLDGKFVDNDRHYVATSFRARVIVYNRNTVSPSELVGYDDLADPRFYRRVAVRPLAHPYNVSLVSEMIADRGREYARNWVEKVKENLAVPPSGNDRKQATLVANGVADIGIMNTYYYGLLMTNNRQRSVANRTQIFFPEQNGKGAYVLYGGIALANNSSNREDAEKFIEFMLNRSSQLYMAFSTFEYPVIKGIPMSPITQGFGEGQPGIEKGKAKFNHIGVSSVANNRDLAVQLLLSR